MEKCRECKQNQPFQLFTTKALKNHYLILQKATLFNFTKEELGFVKKQIVNL
jgi:hypothetical protein